MVKRNPKRPQAVPTVARASVVTELDLQNQKAYQEPFA